VLTILIYGLVFEYFIDSTAFKLYAPGVGLLCAMSDIDIRTVLQGNKLFAEFKGAFLVMQTRTVRFELI
jgi:hypothetical protein